MWDFIFVILQIFLWVVVGAFYVVMLALPIIAAIAVFEFVMSLTVNNVFMWIHKIPFIGPVISGAVCSGIGVVMCILGIIVWVNYLFIVLRCIGGARV